MTALPEVDPSTLGLERALVVGAHPDDAEFSAGGTAARLAASGCAVHLVVCTDGCRGGRERADMAPIRAREQTAAAREIGFASVANLGRSDGELVADGALVRDVVAAIRRVRPQLVLTHDPETRYRRFGARTFMGHSDHRATGAATLDAIYPRAGNPNFFPDQLDDPDLVLWEPAHLWLFDTADFDGWVDISDTLEPKLRALRCHASQAQAGGGLVDGARAVAMRTGDGNRPGERFAIHRLRGAQELGGS